MALALAALAAVEPACGSRYQQVSSAESWPRPPASGPGPPTPDPALPAGRFRRLWPSLWPTRRRGLAGRAGPGRAPRWDSRPPRARPIPLRPGAALGRWKTSAPQRFPRFPRRSGPRGRTRDPREAPTRGRSVFFAPLLV